MELLVQRRMLLLLEADGEDCPKVAEMTSWLGAPTLLCCLARCMALRRTTSPGRWSCRCTLQPALCICWLVAPLTL